MMTGANLINSGLVPKAIKIRAVILVPAEALILFFFAAAVNKNKPHP